jgi:hypothetical protein
VVGPVEGDLGVCGMVLGFLGVGEEFFDAAGGGEGDLFKELGGWLGYE